MSTEASQPANTPPRTTAPDLQEAKDQRKFDKWRKSLMYITGVGLSDEEKAEYKKLLDKELEEYQCKQCVNWRDSLMKNSKSSIP